MKLSISKIGMLLVMWFAFTPFAFSQATPQTAPDTATPASAADTADTGADDGLAFMKHEETRETDSVGTGSIVLKTFGAMLIIVGLIFFAAWGLKKFGFGPKSSSKAEAPELTIVSTVTVGSGRTISSIKFGSRILLVGSTPQSFTLLADGADDEPFSVAASTSPRSVAEMLAAEDSFGEELARADATFGAWAAQGGRS